MRSRNRYNRPYQGHCDVCGQILGSSAGCWSGKHSRAEQIVYRIRAIESDLKYANPDDPMPEARALVREHAQLVTEWWALPKADIDYSAANLSPSKDRLLTAIGNLSHYAGYGGAPDPVGAINNRAAKIRLEIEMIGSRYRHRRQWGKSEPAPFDFAGEARKLARAAMKLYPELREGREAETLFPLERTA